MKKIQRMKHLRRILNSIKTNLLKIQIEREGLNSGLQRLISYLVPLFLAISNSSYTFQADIYQNYEFLILFKSFLYLSPDQLAILSESLNYFLIPAYVLVILPIFLVSVQLYYKIIKNIYLDWVTYTINLVFPVVFRLLLMPIINILMWSVKISVLNESSQISSKQGYISIVLLLVHLLETGLFLLIFSVNTLKTRKIHVFACLNLLGDSTIILNCYLMAFINTVISKKEVWQNFLRVVLHGIVIHTLITKQPYYHAKTNMILIFSYIFSLITSAGYLVAYNINSVAISLFFNLILSIPTMYIAYLFFMKRRLEIKERVKKEINFVWELDFVIMNFVEEFDKNKKEIPSGELEKISVQACEELESYFIKNAKLGLENLMVYKCLFFLYLNQPEKVYFLIFIFSLKKNSFIYSVQMKKIELIVEDFKILEEFYSKYFTFSAKCKKYDLAVSLYLNKLCSELYKNYPSLTKIESKLKILMKNFKKCLKMYSALMKDYQSQENLELYGSFLLNILNDSKGSKYLTLAKNIEPESYIDSRGFWLLNKQTGYCVFSAQMNDYGKIIECNYQFFDILHLNKDIASENIFDFVYGPLSKIAQELLENTLSKLYEFEIIKECLRSFVDYDSFLIDIELLLMPINWKKSKHLLLAIRPVNKILIIVDKYFNIQNVSRNFVNKVIGAENKNNFSFLLSKKLTYFLPNFHDVYKENSSFEYEILNNSEKMEITSKTLKFKQNEYIFLTVSKFSKSMFRRNSLVASLKRKQSLSIIQIGDSHNIGKSKILNKSVRSSNNQTALESKKYDYEPESFDLSKRVKKSNKETFSSILRKRFMVKFFLVLLYLLSLIGMIGTLIYLLKYVDSFNDSVAIGEYSDILGEVLKITIDARYFHLLHLGYFPQTYNSTIRGFLSESTQKLSDLLDSVDKKGIIKDNDFYNKDLVDLILIKGNLTDIKKTSIQDSVRRIISYARVLNNSNDWNNEAFLFLYMNGHNYIIDNFFESIHLAVQDFNRAQLNSEKYLFVIIIVPQVFMLIFVLIGLLPQLRNIGKSYKELLREITKIKKDQLKKISEAAVKRMKVYYLLNREVKNTDRNRKPEVKKHWKVNAVLLISVSLIYFIIVNVSLTIAASNLNNSLKVYTGENLMALSNYIYISLFWLIETFIANYPIYSYDTIMPSYLRDGNKAQRVYDDDENILRIINELRLKIDDQNSIDFLLSKACEVTSDCVGDIPGGLYSKLLELKIQHESGLKFKYQAPFQTFSNQYEKIENLKQRITTFRKICRSYTKKILENSNFIIIGVSINLSFGLGLALLYCIRFKSTLRKIFRFASFLALLVKPGKLERVVIKGK